jgi:hypothetical protein
MSSENDNAITVVHRKWPEDQAIDDAEDGRVDSNPKCERQNEGRNESRVRPK